MATDCTAGSLPRKEEVGGRAAWRLTLRASRSFADIYGCDASGCCKSTRAGQVSIKTRNKT